MRRQSVPVLSALQIEEEQQEQEHSPRMLTRSRHWSPRQCALAIAGSPRVCLLAVITSTLLLMITANSTSGTLPRLKSAAVLPVEFVQQRGGQLMLLHNARPVVTGWAVPPGSVSANDGPANCTLIRLAAGGAFHVSIATSGHWYGGPTMARGSWPASLNRIARQPWRSHDMLAEREGLGSVLEGTWLTSTGASIRMFSASGGLDLSFNVPCDREAAPGEGKLCIYAGSSAVEVELCAATDVLAAQRALLRRLPRPTVPQPPSLELLRAPIWSTWARFKMDVDQAKTEAYASEIVSRDFARSHLEIDDRWSTKYGDLVFDPRKFPDAVGMVRRLAAQGFTVTLWITPFAELTSAAFAEGAADGHWLRTSAGVPAVVTWWQGEGVVLNVSRPEALAWFEARLRTFMDATGVRGYKFDAGEAVFVPDGAMGDPNEFAGEWARFAARFGGAGEVRSAHASQDAGLWTREFDKDSRWGYNAGLRALITAALQMGVVG